MRKYYCYLNEDFGLVNHIVYIISNYLNAANDASLVQIKFEIKWKM